MYQLNYFGSPLLFSFDKLLNIIYNICKVITLQILYGGCYVL